VRDGPGVTFTVHEVSNIYDNDLGKWESLLHCQSAGGGTGGGGGYTWRNLAGRGGGEEHRMKGPLGSVTHSQ
jgi:hypothetical protein